MDRAAEGTAVFLLDDHRVFTDLLALALETQDDLRCVGVAHTVAEATTTAATVAFDVAIIDLQLPDGSGLSAVPQLLALRPDARIIVLTAHPRADLARRALEAGAAGFLAKDAPLAEILRAVRAAAAGHPVGGVSAPPAATVRMTRREIEVLTELGHGLDASRIAAALGISVHTARDHIKAVMAKLDVHTQLEAVVTADRLGLITVGSRY